MLKVGAVLNFILALGHVVCMAFLYEAFAVYHIDEPMRQLAAIAPCIPYLITVVLVVLFTLAGLYALSAVGAIRRLPLLRLGVFTIAFVYLSRGVMGAVGMVGSWSAPVEELLASLAALCIGLLYLFGGLFEYRPKRNSTKQVEI